MSEFLAILENMGSNASLRHAPIGCQSSYFGQPGSLAPDEFLEKVGFGNEQKMIPMIFPVE